MKRPPSPPIRTFKIFDAMILVASVAGWLALTLHFGARTNMRTIWYLGNLGPVRMLQNQFALLFLILSLTTIVLRLLPPRPSRRRLWTQPGFTACVAAVFGVLLFVVENRTNRLASSGSSWPNDVNLWPSDWSQFGFTVIWTQWPYVGPCVAGAWLWLAQTGLWRAEPSLIDRLGRVVGIAWLAEFFLCEGQFGRWTYILAHIFLGVGK